MCDTIVSVPDEPGDPVLFGKSSDREPGEAQLVEALVGGATPRGPTVRCTHLAVPDAGRRHAVLLSRPFWMWGCEMGANERGVVAGNEAVFTRLPVAREGLLGMDLMRLALERASSAREAVDVVTELLATQGQGGAAGYRHRGFRYHNSFIFADHEQAWVLETAGPFWAAERVSGVRTISNVLTIGARHDLVHPGAADEARRRGWRARGQDLDFARAFGDPIYRRLTGGEIRRACTRAALVGAPRDAGAVMAALRSHAGLAPADGWVMRMPCAHAAGLPTRAAGQTTASMVSVLARGGARHWLTGTSAPCLSVWKPAPLDGGGVFGPAPAAGFDGDSLFWRHERFHRAVLVDHETRSRAGADARAALERDGLAGDASARELWERHREALPGWTAAARALPARARWPLFARFWRRQSELDGVPA